jgi:hypothetical protein
MILGQVERYVIEQEPNAVVIRMRQGGNALRLCAIAAVVLGVSWWFGPYGPQPRDLDASFFWIWCAGWTMFLLFGLLGALYREDWTIGAQEIAVRRSFGGTGRVRTMARTSPLKLAVVRDDARGHKRRRDAVFPWLVCFLDASGNRTKVRLKLQRRDSVDALLAALRSGVTLEVHDLGEKNRV